MTVKGCSVVVCLINELFFAHLCLVIKLQTTFFVYLINFKPKLSLKNKKNIFILSAKKETAFKSSQKFEFFLHIYH